MPHVVLATRAKAELHQAANWWAENRSAEQAIRWYEAFVEMLDSLANQAERYPLARENDKFPYEIRELYFGLGVSRTHRAVFTIRANGVLVLTIRHVAQADIEAEDLCRRM